MTMTNSLQHKNATSRAERSPWQQKQHHMNKLHEHDKITAIQKMLHLAHRLICPPYRSIRPHDGSIVRPPDPSIDRLPDLSIRGAAAQRDCTKFRPLWGGRRPKSLVIWVLQGGDMHARSIQRETPTQVPMKHAAQHKASQACPNDPHHH